MTNLKYYLTLLLFLYSPLFAFSQSEIFYTDPLLQTINKVNIDGDSPTVLVSSGIDTPHSLDYGLSKVCWTDIGLQSLSCANEDGTGVTTIASLTIAIPVKVEIDELNGKVYWSESNFFVSDAIRRANLDGSMVETIINPPDTDPLSTFTVDSNLGKIFYVKGTLSLANIYSSNLDGSGETLIVSNIIDIGDLALDTSAGKIYWDEEIDSEFKKISRANLDGSSTEVVVPSISNPAGELEVQAGASKVYWSDRGTAPSISRISNSSILKLLDTSPVNSTFGFGLKFEPGAEINIQGNGSIINNGDINPSSFDDRDFGSVDVNTGVSQRIFSIHNCGDQGLDVSNVLISGSNPLDYRVVALPSTPLSPFSGSSTFTIEFDPAIPGPSSAIITVLNSDSDESSYSFTVAGTGTGFASSEIALSFSSSQINNNDITPDVLDGTDFQSVNVGSSLNHSFEIESLGVVDLNLTGSPIVNITGVDAASFTVVTQPSSIVTSILPETFTISFSPISTGIKTAVVEIENDDGNENPFAFIIQGNGTPQVVSNPNPAPNPNPIIDTDGDGLTDAEELALGTNINLVDTDGDGVSDFDEIQDGSDPLDNSSFIFKLERTFCADWNGFIGMIFNIAEYVNFTASSRNIQSTLFDISGQQQSQENFSVISGAQTDRTVHDMAGWSVDSIGTVCSELVDPTAVPGDIDGRMLMYKPDGLGNFDFVLVMPFSNPVSGPVFVQYNTFHPSLDPAEIGFFASNWFTVANSETTAQSGSVIVYANDGSVLQNITATLPANGRQDFGIHEFGANRIGLLEWRPDSVSAQFRVTLNRYLYEDFVPSLNVSEAVSLPAVRGSLQPLIAPVDTRGLTSVLEISNTSSSSANVIIEVDDRSGNRVLDSTTQFLPRETKHIILDGFLVNDLGVARIVETTGSEVVVNVMQYGRNSTAGISNYYALFAREALGDVMQGSYNTFLDQGCSLLLGNLSQTSENVVLNATRFDGTAVVSNQVLTVPANGVLEFDICGLDIPNVFGAVRVEPTNPNNIVANIVRLGKDDNYRIATPVR